MTSPPPPRLFFLRTCLKSFVCRRFLPETQNSISKKTKQNKKNLQEESSALFQIAPLSCWLCVFVCLGGFFASKILPVFPNGAHLDKFISDVSNKVFSISFIYRTKKKFPLFLRSYFAFMSDFLFLFLYIFLA